jgi:hypothetical protein
MPHAAYIALCRTPDYAEWDVDGNSWTQDLQDLAPQGIERHSA